MNTYGNLALSDLGKSDWSEFNLDQIDPATATGSTNDNKSNTFLGGLFETGKGLLTYAGKTWVDQQIKGTAEQKQLSQEQAQFATNYWNAYNGSGPIDPGLAAVYSRLDPTGKFYANPMANRGNPQPPVSASQASATGNALLLAGIAIAGALIIFVAKR